MDKGEEEKGMVGEGKERKGEEDFRVFSQFQICHYTTVSKVSK